MRIFETPRSGFVPRIRMINLIDILFILLIFFVATTTFRVAAEHEKEAREKEKEKQSAVKLSLPEAKTAEEVGREKIESLQISVTADEKIFVGDSTIQLAALEKILREAKEKNPDVVLQFSADKSVSYGTIVGIVDAARAAGINNLTAFTKKSVKTD